MGLPLVTCLGQSFAGQVAASLLRAIGLPSLVTNSLEEYEKLALRIAREPAMLQELRECAAKKPGFLPAVRSPICIAGISNPPTSGCGRLGSAGESPTSFAVESVTAGTILKGVVRPGTGFAAALSNPPQNAKRPDPSGPGRQLT